MLDSNQENVKAEIGQIIDISLESMMGSTGYAWELSQLEGPVNLVGITIVPSSTRAIAPVTQIFKFRCTAAGTAKVSFVLTAGWKIEKPVKEASYEIEVTEAQESNEDNLKLEGFVSPPKATVGGSTTTLYNVLPQLGLDPRVYYGVFPPQTAGDPRLYYGVNPPLGMDPRVYYGVFPPQTAGDPRLYYGVNPPLGMDPRVYYGVFPPQNSGSIATLYNVQPQLGLDPRVYYGVFPPQTAGDPRFYYGVLPAYNVSPPVYKYGILPGADATSYRMARPYDVCPPNNTCC
jgi:hypothetical protein